MQPFATEMQPKTVAKLFWIKNISKILDIEILSKKKIQSKMGTANYATVFLNLKYLYIFYKKKIFYMIFFYKIFKKYKNYKNFKNLKKKKNIKNIFFIKNI